MATLQQCITAAMCIHQRLPTELVSIVFRTIRPTVRNLYQHIVALNDQANATYETDEAASIEFDRRMASLIRLMRNKYGNVLHGKKPLQTWSETYMALHALVACMLVDLGEEFVYDRQQGIKKLVDLLTPHFGTGDVESARVMQRLFDAIWLPSHEDQMFISFPIPGKEQHLQVSSMVHLIHVINLIRTMPMDASPCDHPFPWRCDKCKQFMINHDAWKYVVRAKAFNSL